MLVPDETHDPGLQSWVDSANSVDTDFPIQNLPFGRFRIPNEPYWRIGVAIGNQILDLRGAGLIDSADMKDLLALSPDAHQRLRSAISQGLRRGSAREKDWSKNIYPQADTPSGLPCDIGDYTDFYIGIHHATAVGKLFRPDNPLLPNYKWVPIGYHGRASTIQVSGQDFFRPHGQIASAQTGLPTLEATRRLDFELELGVIIGRPNSRGIPIAMPEAENHIFGLTLFNDWSARDIQTWEYQPLGPFLSKNFASTISPWMVTLEALAPFRKPWLRPADDPQPLPYLESETNRLSGAIDIRLGVYIQTSKMRELQMPPQLISQSNFAQAAYWSLSQMVAHHTVNGCTLNSGDLFGTGTLSGSGEGQSGSMLEISQGGTRPLTLASGETRTFLLDGDCITFKGHCEAEGRRRIGFGECSATVLRPSDLF